MMLVTFAVDPASWLAIEPQKFSAATTLSPAGAGVVPHPHMASAAAAASARITVRRGILTETESYMRSGPGVRPTPAVCHAPAVHARSAEPRADHGARRDRELLGRLAAAPIPSPPPPARDLRLCAARRPARRRPARRPPRGARLARGRAWTCLLPRRRASADEGARTDDRRVFPSARALRAPDRSQPD